MSIHEQDNQHNRQQETAESAGLIYVSDAMPGIRRRRAGKGFSYTDPQGRTLRDREELERIKQLAIPPAWTDVWICPRRNGHILATGRDSKGRKQYRYHPLWRQLRDEDKYGRLIAFGTALPAIRARVEQDLKRQGLPREKVLAAVVKLLETTLIRVGNEEYARANGSFGLTTMRDQHVEVNGASVRFEFRGKAGIRHSVDIADRRLARIIKQCRDIPGYDLFQYIDDEGQRQDVRSEDVNAYLQQASGQEFTAKDFRTWAGTVLAALALEEFEAFDTQSQAKSNVVRAIEAVAQRLGNTPSICRKCYVHPEVLNVYLEGSLLEMLKHRAEHELAESLSGLQPEEAAVLALLQQRLAREQEQRDEERQRAVSR